MSKPSTFKQNLAAISRLWEKGDYAAALAKVEDARKAWPGNAHLCILWASLVQLQENPIHPLNDAKRTLREAMELEASSSATGAIELGHFLDAVADDPQTAAKVYAEAVATARRMLMEALLGQAKALRQLEKRQDANRCLLELLHLLQFDPDPKGTKSDGAAAEIIFRSPAGVVFAAQTKGDLGNQVEELLSEMVASRSA